MMNNKILSGAVHKLPGDLRQVISEDKIVREVWQEISPLARNEWICWVISAKKEETRRIRIEKLQSKIRSGMRRPCCWAGCPHR